MRGINSSAPCRQTGMRPARPRVSVMPSPCRWAWLCSSRNIIQKSICDRLDNMVGLGMKKNPGWFKKGVKRPWSDEHRANHKAALQSFRGDNHWNWKGDLAGYKSIHEWLRTNWGVPDKCERCESTKNVVWANKRNRYIRVREEWLWLCGSCHKRHDHIVLNIKRLGTRHIKIGQ